MNTRRREPRIGNRVKNLEVLLEFPFCFQIFSAVASNRCVDNRKLRVLVSPYHRHFSRLVLGDLNNVEFIDSCSIPQELSYMGTATLGVDRIIPKEEFEGDIGNDGRPYEHFTALNVKPIKSIIIDGKEHFLSQIVDKPLLIANSKSTSNKEIKELINEIEWLIHTKSEYEWRRVRIQSENGKNQTIQSHKTIIISDIVKTDCKLLMEKTKSIAINPDKEVALINMTQLSENEILRKLDWYLTPHIISIAGNPKHSKLSKRIQQLSEQGFRYVVFFGNKELSEGAVTLKDLKTREQRELKFEDFSSGLKDYLFSVEKTKGKHIFLVQEPGYPGTEKNVCTQQRNCT